MLSIDSARWMPLLLVLGLTVGLASCGDDDPGPEDGAPTPSATGEGGAAAQATGAGGGGTDVAQLAPAPEAPTEPLVVVGVVRDESGRPAANLAVGAAPMLMGLGGPLKDMGDRQPARAVTDERGQFELRAPTAMTMWVGPLIDSNGAVPEGETELFGYPTRVVLDAEEPVAPLEFTVRPGNTLRGRVQLTDEMLRAMDSKQLRVKGTGERTGVDVTARVLLDGSFELGPLDDETLSLVASSNAFLGVPVLGVPSDAQDVVLELVAPRAIRVDAVGEGAARARSDCYRDGASALEWSKNLMAGRSERWLLEGPHTVVVRSDAAGTVGVARVEETGTLAEPVVVEVELQPAGALKLSNDTDGPRLVVVTLADLPVLSWAAAVGRQQRILVPFGDLVVRELDLAGNELANRVVSVGAGATRDVRLPLER